jgi:hypothetical protein
VLVLSLCQQLCPEKIPVKTTERLGQGGADGETFAIEKDPNKVIKFSIIYDRFNKTPDTIYQQDILPVLDYLITNKPGICPTIYQHECLGEYSRPMDYWKDGLQKFLIHYYIMEKLFPITEDEKKVFHSIASHEDRGIKKDFSSEKIDETLQGLARGLDFDEKMITLFCTQLRGSSIQFNDLHPRNIMKNNFNQFKIIDFDRCQLLNLEKC